MQKRSQHAPTFTPRRLQHGAMLFLWRKTQMPHRNRSRNTLQTQKAKPSSSSHVVCHKQPHPHKESKRFHPLNKGGLVKLCLFEFKAFLNRFLLLRRKHFFLATGTPQRFNVTQNDAVHLKIKLHLNIFHAAGWTKQRTGFGGVIG